MRNGGTSPPDEVGPADDGSLVARSERALHKIAESLGVPFDAFRTMVAAPNDRTTESERPATEDECRELLAAFRRIGNPHVRRRYLAILQSLAKP